MLRLCGKLFKNSIICKDLCGQVRIFSPKVYKNTENVKTMKTTTEAISNNFLNKILVALNDWFPSACWQITT